MFKGRLLTWIFLQDQDELFHLTAGQTTTGVDEKEHVQAETGFNEKECSQAVQSAVEHVE